MATEYKIHLYIITAVCSFSFSVFCYTEDWLFPQDWATIIISACITLYDVMLLSLNIIIEWFSKHANKGLQLKTHLQKSWVKCVLVNMKWNEIYSLDIGFNLKSSAELRQHTYTIQVQSSWGVRTQGHNIGFMVVMRFNLILSITRSEH